MKVGDLRPAEYNPRKISDAQSKALKQALEVFGDLGGIIFNRRTGNLVGGHQRVKTLDASWPIKITESSRSIDGEKLIPDLDKCGTVARGFIETPFGPLSYREVVWEEKVERAANVAANKHGGEWDDDKLRDLLVLLDDGSGLLELTGFGSVDLEGLVGHGTEDLPTPSENDRLFEQITFTVTKSQLATIGFALDTAAKSGPFENTVNENKRGNALFRIAEYYRHTHSSDGQHSGGH